MSRSYRKTPIHGITTAASEKADKQTWHSSFRSRERQKLHRFITRPDTEHITTHALEVSDVWGMAKDGRRYWEKPAADSHWRGRWERMMRK